MDNKGQKIETLFVDGCLTALVLSVIFWVLLIMMLPGCSPKIIETVRVEKEVQTVHHHDTVSTRDSVYIREWMKGDTIYVDRFRDRYFYRDRWRDSIQVKEQHDTTVIEKKVEKDLSPAQKMKINSFWWLISAVTGLLVWTFRKKIFTIIKKF